MSGTLFVVATPIGNLEDVTLRALRVLREVDLIAAEDTRRTAGLLAHHGIHTPTLSFHQHNQHSRIPQLISRLESGAAVAVVTDAGTPGVSDPGIELIDACVKAGLAVVPVPGVSAPLTAAIASGFPVIPLTFFGFIPRRSKDRTDMMSVFAKTDHTFTFFESPHRIHSTLQELAIYLGKRQIAVGRELTKKHEEFVRGTADEVLKKLDSPRGEFTVVVGPAQIVDSEHDSNFDPNQVADAVACFWQLTNTGALSRREAVSQAARQFGLRSSLLYNAIELAKVGASPEINPSAETSRRTKS